MNWKKQRTALVNDYIKPFGVTDQKVISAFLNVPRHEFVPKGYQSEAYFDAALPIGEGQTISQPSLVAQMTQLLELKGGEKVLEIGTGSGYQTAILSHLATEVYTVEIVQSLAKKAQRILKKLNCTNVYVSVANGSLGLPQKAPFDAIIVTAGAVKIPRQLIDQLKENGRIVIPVGTETYSQKLLLGVKKKGKLETREIELVAFVPLIGKYLGEK